MPSSKATADQLLRLLRTNGAMSGSALVAALGISRPTLSRLVAAAGDSVLRFGNARASTYVATGNVRGEREWPIYQIDENAQISAIGMLIALHGDGFFVSLTDAARQLLQPPLDTGAFESLPWFLDDQRPQGFLGRLLARRVAGSLGLSTDLMLWSARDTLIALLAEGHDLAGNLVIGDRGLDRALQGITTPSLLALSDRPAAYVERAAAALRGDAVGSSAAGEQPKFTAVLDGDPGPQPVIVKFSALLDTAVGARWADMLRMEHLAGVVLNDHGIAAAHSEVHAFGGRLFLQSTRFDRTPCLGRRGFVSLFSLDSAFYADDRHRTWRSLAPLLARDGWLSHESAYQLEVINWFGVLIGNTDMHFGNMGLLQHTQRPWSLAPVYDMLPMVLRPAANGEVVDRDIEVPAPPAGQFEQWQEAATLAFDFWTRVTGDMAIDVAVRAIAGRALQNIARVRDRLRIG